MVLYTDEGTSRWQTAEDRPLRQSGSVERVVHTPDGSRVSAEWEGGLEAGSGRSSLKRGDKWLQGLEGKWIVKGVSF